MSIQERGNSYRICVYKGIINGKKQWHKETFKGNSIQARKRETQIKSELANGIYIKPTKITFRDYLLQWLDDYSKHNHAPGTYESYEQQARNHIIPALGNIVLTNLTKSAIDNYYSTKSKEGLSAQTIHNHHTELHKILESAINKGLINRNPSDGVELPRVKKQEMQVWSIDEVKIFLETAKRVCLPEYFVIFHTVLHTGMSRSEILALRWKNVDLVNKQIHIDRGLIHTRKGEFIFKQNKTKTRRRNIDITSDNLEVLKEYEAFSKQTRKDLKKDHNSESLVFCRWGIDDPVLPGTVSHMWTRIAKLAKLNIIRLHDARHTHASILLMLGVHPKIVQERLGHSSIQITLDTYSHFIPTMQGHIMDSFDKAFKDSDSHNVTR